MYSPSGSDQVGSMRHESDEQTEGEGRESRVVEVPWRWSRWASVVTGCAGCRAWDGAETCEVGARWGVADELVIHWLTFMWERGDQHIITSAAKLGAGMPSSQSAGSDGGRRPCALDSVCACWTCERATRSGQSRPPTDACNPCLPESECTHTVSVSANYFVSDWQHVPVGVHTAWGRRASSGESSKACHASSRLDPVHIQHSESQHSSKADSRFKLIDAAQCIDAKTICQSHAKGEILLEAASAADCGELQVGAARRGRSSANAD